MEKLLGGLFLEIRVRGDGLVEVVDVGGMVLAVMQGHGFRVDERFQGVGRVGEGRESKRARGRRRGLRA